MFLKREGLLLVERGWPSTFFVEPDHLLIGLPTKRTQYLPKMKCCSEWWGGATVAPSGSMDITCLVLY